MYYIAIVEEDAAVLDSIQLVVETEGWQSDGFGSGLAFLSETHHRLRAISGQDYPVIGMIARDRASIARTLAEHNVTQVLDKPILAGDLIAKMMTTLTSR